MVFVYMWLKALSSGNKWKIINKERIPIGRMFRVS